MYGHLVPKTEYAASKLTTDVGQYYGLFHNIKSYFNSKINGVLSPIEADEQLLTKYEPIDIPEPDFNRDIIFIPTPVLNLKSDTKYKYKISDSNRLQACTQNIFKDFMHYIKGDNILTSINEMGYSNDDNNIIRKMVKNQHHGLYMFYVTDPLINHICDDPEMYDQTLNDIREIIIRNERANAYNIWYGVINK